MDIENVEIEGSKDFVLLPDGSVSAEGGPVDEKADVADMIRTLQSRMQDFLNSEVTSQQSRMDAFVQSEIANFGSALGDLLSAKQEASDRAASISDMGMEGGSRDLPEPNASSSQTEQTGDWRKYHLSMFQSLTVILLKLLES